MDTDSRSGSQAGCGAAAVRYLVLPLFLLCLPVGATEVYQSTDEAGNAAFSDQPTQNSQAVKIQETNVGESVDAPPPAPKPEGQLEAQPAPKLEAVEGEMIAEERDDDDGGGRNSRPQPKPKPKPKP